MNTIWMSLLSLLKSKRVYVYLASLVVKWLNQHGYVFTNAEVENFLFQAIDWITLAAIALTKFYDDFKKRRVQ